MKCHACERCTWNPGPDCGVPEHPVCPSCGHCMGRHVTERTVLGFMRGLAPLNADAVAAEETFLRMMSIATQVPVAYLRHPNQQEESMTRYGTQLANTPQTSKARPDQKENSAGGFVFGIDKWKQLDRWLILGAMGGTYYAGESKLVRENAEIVHRCLADNGPRVVERIVEISDSGRAPKNDPAIFALALAAGSKDPLTRKAALEALPKVCRIGTHLFHFAADVKTQRRWGRSLRRAVGAWYTDRPLDSLAMQAVKYQQRDGWSHRDLLRLSHASSPAHNPTLRWMVGGKDAMAKETKRGGPIDPDLLPKLIVGFEKAHAATTAKDVAAIVCEYGLPREAVPTEWLGETIVWEALLPDMGPTALIRNLGKLSAIGMTAPMSSTTKSIVAKLTDELALKRARVHPIQAMLAAGVYGQGRGDKGKLTWTPERAILDALDEAFYLAFASIVPTGKNHLLAIDVSGSMDSGTIAGAPGITPRAAAAAMAMVTARAEKNWHIVGFTSGPMGHGGRWGGGDPGLTPIDVSPKMRLDRVAAEMSKLPMGGTDCALPMLYAMANKIEVDTFVVFTDNETWAGKVHPFEALKRYRAAMSRPAAQLIVEAFTPTEFTIADPTDAGMLDVIGMDGATPQIIADFARGLC